MPFKRNTTSPKPEIKLKNILRFIAPCFEGSPIIEDETDQFDASKEKKKLRLPNCFKTLPNFMKNNKKKKIKRTIPFDLQSAPSSLSLFSSSSNGVSTDKARNSNGWCKRKHKTPPFEPPSEPVSTESTTTSMYSINRNTTHSGPIHNPANHTNGTSLLRRAIHRTRSTHNMARTGRLKLGAGLWVMISSLGVMLMLGRATAVLFLCSCWYVVPMVIEEPVERN